MSSRDRSGFTMIELLVVAVLGTVLLLAAYETLITNQRVYTAHSLNMEGREALRASTQVLSGELREISVDGGDLLDMGDDFITIRSVGAVAFVCVPDYATSPPTLRVREVRGRTFPDDSVLVLADNDPEIRDDDVWLRGTVSSTSSGTSCPDGEPGRDLVIQGLGTTDSVRVGGPLRVFRRYTYSLTTIDDESYLARQRPGGPVNPVVGPLGDPSREGLSFEYFDATGAPVTSPSAVEWIQITARTPAHSVGGREVSDSLVVRVRPRN